MKAVVIHEYGGPEVLKYEDIARPEPKDDQLLIRVIAAGVNPVDGMIRSGMFDKDGKRAFPIILGGDVAGVVEKVGSKVTKFKAGDPVFAYVSLDNSGGYAQYALGDRTRSGAQAEIAHVCGSGSGADCGHDSVAGANRDGKTEGPVRPCSYTADQVESDRLRFKLPRRAARRSSRQLQLRIRIS